MQMKIFGNFDGQSVERKLSIPVSLLQDSKYPIGILIIWNACYLECLLFGMLGIWNTFIHHQVSLRFHWFTHYLYTTDFSVYLENQSLLIPSNFVLQARSEKSAFLKHHLDPVIVISRSDFDWGLPHLQATCA